MPSPFPNEDVAVPCDETSAMFGVWTPQPVDIRQLRRVVLIALLLLAALLALTHGAPGTWKMLVVTIGLGLALMTYEPIQRVNVPVGRATTIGTLAACVGVAAILGFAVAERAVFAPAALALGFVVGAAILVNDRMRTIRRGA